jgi:hypothetical protein
VAVLVEQRLGEEHRDDREAAQPARRAGEALQQPLRDEAHAGA